MRLAHNESHNDRALRIVIGALLLALFLGGQGAWWGVTLLVTGSTLVVTGLVGFDPIYWLFHFSTDRPSGPLHN